MVPLQVPTKILKEEKAATTKADEETVSKRKHNSNMTTPISQRRTPVIGVLTEPLRGSLRKDNIEVTGINEYIPLAHVKFLEQAGFKVVPVRFTLVEEDLLLLLSQINGIYIPGDSDEAVNNERYMWAFDSIVEYVLEKNEKSHFPMYVMGNGFVQYIANRAPLNKGIFKRIHSMTNKALPLRPTINPDDSYLLDSIQKHDLPEFFESAPVFNRQSVVITLDDFNKEAHLNRRL
jgi:hypothetical protein